MRKSIHMLGLAALLAAALVPKLHAGPTQAQDRQLALYADVTATTSAVNFFKPNGSTAAAVTYTTSSLVPQAVYIEKMEVSGQDATTAMKVRVVSTDTTYTAGTNEKVLKTVSLDQTSVTAKNLTDERTWDFTNSGTSLGLYCPKWPAVIQDTWGNTPNVRLYYKKAPYNATRP